MGVEQASKGGIVVGMKYQSVNVIEFSHYSNFLISYPKKCATWKQGLESLSAPAVISRGRQVGEIRLGGWIIKIHLAAFPLILGINSLAKRGARMVVFKLVLFQVQPRKLVEVELGV